MTVAHYSARYQSVTVESTIEFMVVRIPGSDSSHASPGSREPARFNSRAMAFKGQSPGALLPPGKLHGLKGPQSITQKASTQHVSLQGYLRLKP